MSNITFAIIKPDAVEKNVIGEITAMITQGGFKIRGMRMTKLSNEQAGNFYSVHKERPFYNDLVAYMTSGPVVVLSLQKENAVADFRVLIGATNPADAADGTVRKLYGASIENNAVHGSDSDENAQIETSFFFRANELV